MTGRMISVAVRSESAAHAESGLTASDEIEYARAREAPKHLRYDVGYHVRRRKPLADAEPYGDRRIEVTPGNVADGVRHCHDGKAECQRDAHKSNAEVYG